MLDTFPPLLRPPVFALALLYTTWAFYLLAMSLTQARRAGKLTRAALAMGYPLVLIGLILDFLLNMVSSVMFLDPPRELLLTTRCNRYIDTYTDWRRAAALWLCRNLLDPFEIGGHCHKAVAEPTNLEARGE